MQTVSSKFLSKIDSLSQTTCLKASLTYKNKSGEVITEELKDEDFFGDGVKTVSDCMSSGDFTFGSTVCKELTCTLDNTKEKYHGCNFIDGKIVIYSGLVFEDNTEEYVKLGEFNLEKAGKPASTVKLTGYDNMLKFDVPVKISATMKLDTMGGVINAACAACGVELSLKSIKNSDVSINPNFDEGMTWREVIGWCSAVAGGFARIDRDGKLEIVSFKKENAYEINPERTRLSITVDNHHEITGVIYYGTKEPVVFGTTTYPIIIEENKVFEMISEDTLNSILEELYNEYSGTVYCGFNLEYLGNPALDEGDYLYLPSSQGDDVYALCGKCEFKHSGKSSLSCPNVSFYDKQYEQNGREEEEESEATPTGENLLLISQFTKAFLPYDFVGTWSYTNYNTEGLECLDTYMMTDGRNKIWLPFKGNLKPSTKYTLSLYIKSRDKRKTPTWHLCLVPLYNVFQSGQGVILNGIADDSNSVTGDSAKPVLGKITLTADWQWQTITFTTPSNLPYQNEGQEGYMLAMYADQQGFYGTENAYYENYAAYIQKAKLEEGEMATDWTLGVECAVALNQITDENGNILKTLSSSVNSNIAVYGDHTLEIAPATIQYNSDGTIMMMRQKRQNADAGVVNQIIFGMITLRGCNSSLDSGFISIYGDVDNQKLNIYAPGGCFINGVQQ